MIGENHNIASQLIYTAVYVNLGIIPRSQVELLEVSFRSLADNVHTEDSMATKQQKLPLLSKLVHAFENKLQGIEPLVALDKWRWLNRDSSDKLVEFYRIQYDGDILRAVTGIAHAIVFQASQFDSREVLRRGEQYYIHVEPDPQYVEQYKTGKAMFAGVDKMGRPVIDIRVKFHDQHAQSKEAGRRLVVQLAEMAYLCQKDDAPGVVLIFDLSDWGIHRMDYSIAKFMIECCIKSMPIVHKVYIHNAPRLWAVVWSVLKQWLDPWLTRKIMFTRNLSDLLTVISVDQLPKHYGGHLRYDCTQWDDPRLSDDRLMDMEVEKTQLERHRYALFEEFERLTCQWIFGNPDQERRELISDELRATFWELDPYVRSRTIWDRQGVLAQYRAELAPGGLAQPFCIPTRPYHRPSVSHFEFAPTWTFQGSTSPAKAF